MAGTGTISFTLSFLSGDSLAVNASATHAFTTAADNFIEVVQSVGTAAELLNVGDVAEPVGLVIVANLDPTNYVEVALDSGITNKVAKLLPGQFCVVPPAATGWYAKADTAACRCHVVIIPL